MIRDVHPVPGDDRRTFYYINKYADWDSYNDVYDEEHLERCCCHYLQLEIRWCPLGSHIRTRIPKDSSRTAWTGTRGIKSAADRFAEKDELSSRAMTGSSRITMLEGIYDSYGPECLPGVSMRA